MRAHVRTHPPTTNIRAYTSTYTQPPPPPTHPHTHQHIHTAPPPQHPPPAPRQTRHLCLGSIAHGKKAVMNVLGASIFNSCRVLHSIYTLIALARYCPPPPSAPPPPFISANCLSAAFLTRTVGARVWGASLLYVCMCVWGASLLYVCSRGECVGGVSATWM